MDRSPIAWMVEPLRKYAVFQGRAQRAEYWWFVLFGFVVGVIAAIVDIVLGLKALGLGTIISLALIIPQFAVGFRRLHDIGRSGWWVLIPVVLIVPMALALGATIGGGGAPGSGTSILFGAVGVALFAYVVVMLVWFCTRGTVGPNRFGPDPLLTDPMD